MPDLALLFLLISCINMAGQVLAFARLLTQRARTPAEDLVSGGYIRTVASRILAATVYVVVAAVQVAGSGTLSAEALIVFVLVQLLWQLNSALDIRIRRRIGQHGSPPDDR